MTPFTIDQLKAILEAATPIGKKSSAALGTSDLLCDAGYKHAAQFMTDIGLTGRSGFNALIDLAIDGLPADFRRDVGNKPAHGHDLSLFNQVFHHRRPPLVILDAFSKFIAERSNSGDLAGIKSETFPGVVAEQLTGDQTSLDEPAGVLGEDARIDPWKIREESLVAPGSQEHRPE